MNGFLYVDGSILLGQSEIIGALAKDKGSFGVIGKQVCQRILYVLPRNFIRNKPLLIEGKILVVKESVGERRNALRRNEPAQEKFSFFQIPNIFRTLEYKVIPELIDFKESKMDYSIRAWVATNDFGQDVYSLGILFSMMNLPLEFDIKIYGSLSDEAAIEKARDGFFALDDVTKCKYSAQLQDFFDLEQNGFFVNNLVKQKCNFRKFNIESGPLTTGFDLVIANRILEFESQEKVTLIANNLTNSLNASGYLFVDGTDLLSLLGEPYTPHQHCDCYFYQPNCLRESFFRF